MPSTQVWIEFQGGRVPVLLSGPVSWTFKEGVSPSEGVFDLIPVDADRLQKVVSTPVTLRIISEGRDEKITNLWVESLVPAENKFIKRVKLADRRRFWKYGHIVGRYNIRRNIGVHRVTNSATKELNDVLPTVWFAAYSLKNPGAPASDANRWPAGEMLERVVGQAMEAEKRFRKGGDVPKPTINGEIKNLDKVLPIDSLTINERADYGVGRAMSYIPEAAVTVRADGAVVVFSRVNGAEAKYVQMLGPEIANRGHIEIISNENVRPQAIEFLYTIESEVRIDAVEYADGDTVTAIQDQRIAVNVGAVPDFELAIGGVVYAQGTWATLEQLLTAWGVPPGIGGTRLTHAAIQKAQVAYVDLWGPLLLTGARAPNADWVARVACIRDSYRLIYMLPPRWRDRWLSFATNRVGIIDPTSGRRAPSEVYMDYHKIPSMRALYKSRAAGQPLPFAINENGYPGGKARSFQGFTVNDFDEGHTRPAPFTLHVLDEDQGIVGLAPRNDQYRLWEHIGPSKVVLSDDPNSNGPVGDYAAAQDGAVIAFDMVFDANRVPKLSARHKMAFVITAIPASPNDNRQFYKVTVKPEDVKGMIPPAGQAGLNNAKGPIMQVAIGGGLEGARALIRWDDDRAPDIEKLFGVQEGEPNLDGLVLNHDKTLTGKLSTASLTEISKALAARIYARYADHHEGEASGMLQPNLQLDGWIESLSVQVDNQGAVVSHIRLPEMLPEMPFESLLPASLRAILFREVQFTQ